MDEKSMMKRAYDIFLQSGETGLLEWAMSLPDDDRTKFHQEWLELNIQLRRLIKNYLTYILEDNEKEDK